jgi:hypothetical protein
MYSLPSLLPSSAIFGCDNKRLESPAKSGSSVPDNQEKVDDIKENRDNTPSQNWKGRLIYTAKAGLLAGVGMLTAGAGNAQSINKDNAPKVKKTDIENISPQNTDSTAKEPLDVTQKLQDQMNKNETRQEVIQRVLNMQLTLQTEDGEKTIGVTPAELNQERQITTSGFLTGLHIGANDQLDVTINGRTIAGGPRSHDRGLRQYTFSPRARNLPAFNTSVPTFDTENVTIKLSLPGTDTGVEIQLTQQIHSIDKTFPYATDQKPINGIDTTRVTLINETLESLKASTEDLRERFAQAAAGAHKIERVFGTNLVDTLGVMAGKRSNAFVLDNQNAERTTLFFFTPTITEYTRRSIAVVARHETIHHLASEMAFNYDQALKEVWKETDEDVFSFINESNFYDLSTETGHSQYNPKELAASFLNSLFALERIKMLFSQTETRGWSRQVDRYSPEQKKQILDYYQQTLDTLIQHAESQYDRVQDKVRNNSADSISQRERVIVETTADHLAFFQAKKSQIESLKKQY